MWFKSFVVCIRYIITFCLNLALSIITIAREHHRRHLKIFTTGNMSSIKTTQKSRQIHLCQLTKTCKNTTNQRFFNLKNGSIFAICSVTPRNVIFWLSQKLKFNRCTDFSFQRMLY